MGLGCSGALMRLTFWDVPGRDLRLAQQELVVSGALNLTQMGLLHFSGVL